MANKRRNKTNNSKKGLEKLVSGVKKKFSNNSKQDCFYRMEQIYS